MVTFDNTGYAQNATFKPNDWPTVAPGLPPARGLLIAFPSDARYLHAARPVKTGTRYALVSWAAAQNTPRVAARPEGVERLIA